MDKTYFLKKTAIRQQDTSPLGTRALLVGEGNKTNVLQHTELHCNDGSSG